MKRTNQPALEVTLDAQAATSFRSNAHAATQIIERALVDHDFPRRLMILTHGSTLLASISGAEVSFHVPVGATIQEVSLPLDNAHEQLHGESLDVQHP